MRTFLILLLTTIILNTATGQVKVRGYYRKDGTYVRPHYRSNPDGNPYNNWSYPGNTNPYTGRTATGNSSTYLANYYKVSRGYNRTYNSYNSNSFDSYYRLMNRTNYKGMTPHNNYTTNYGTAIYDTKRRFKLYDNSNINVGYVIMSKSTKYYTVYDIDGNKITSNRNHAVLWILLGGAITTAIIYSSDLE